MRVDLATVEDFKSWLVLAAEVEEAFGPLVGVPEFHDAVIENMKRGNAYCVRENDGYPGTKLMGGLLFSPHHPNYSIGWLVVARRWRRQGIGRTLVERVLKLVSPPAQVLVTTFARDDSHGAPAHEFFYSLGFEPALDLDIKGPNGEPRMTLRKRIG